MYLILPPAFTFTMDQSYCCQLKICVSSKQDCSEKSGLDAKKKRGRKNYDHERTMNNNQWFNCKASFDFILPSFQRHMYEALHAQCFPSETKFTDDSGGIQTHDLLLSSADGVTSRPPYMSIPSNFVFQNKMIIVIIEIRIQCPTLSW